MNAFCSTCSGPMDLRDAHIHCPDSLGIDHLKEALTDPCPDCSLMSLEIRQQRLAKFWPGSEDWLTPVKTRTQTGSKRSASKTEGPLKKKRAPTVVLSHQVVELANAVQGIQAFLARSLPPATQNTNEDVRASVVNSLFPRVMPTAECPREDLDTLSLAASDSLGLRMSRTVIYL